MNATGLGSLELRRSAVSSFPKAVKPLIALTGATPMRCALTKFPLIRESGLPTFRRHTAANTFDWWTSNLLILRT